MYASRLLSSWKFLPNRQRIIYKDRKEAFIDFWKVSGANIIWQVGLAILIVEFGFPTPDVVFDIKKAISPDFAVYVKYGELAEYRQEFENKLRSIKFEEFKTQERALNADSPAFRFGSH